MSIKKSNLGFTNMDIADISSDFLKRYNYDFERKALGYGRVTAKIRG